MTLKRRFVLGCSVVSMVGALTGCAVSQKQPFRMSFVPPAIMPAGPSGEITEPPLDIAPGFLDRETPKFLGSNPDIPLRLTELDNRLRRAEERFQSGKRLLAEGDADGARREFDRAIDLLLSTSEATPERQRMERKFEDLVESIHRYDMEALGGGEPDRLLTFEKSPLDEILELTFPIDPRLKNKVKEEVRATVSQLPLEVRDPVLSYINYFSSERGKRTIMAGLRRAGRYRPLISRILDEEGVPQELIQLAQAESGFMPRAISRKAATGMWQFVQFRGREYGLFQSAYHDDRLDPEKATRAAARHLRDLYQQFGDWYLAMAAYNCGPLCVERAVQRTGYADFWELRGRNVLPRETSNYVPAILAMIIVIKNAKDYGVEGVEPDAPLEYDTIELRASTNVALIADAADRPVSLIREMNPSLLKNLAPAGYQLHVPKGMASYVTAALEMVPQTQRNAWRMHRVGEGEALPAIARRFGASVSSILGANRGLADQPEPGDLIVIPATLRPEPRTVARKGAPVRRPAAARASASNSKRLAATAARKPAGKTAVSGKKTGGTVRVAQTSSSKRPAAARN
ncbi:MAG: transglycosylase SLT domain-containing protein [Bryobacterales bacterium]|nr:transglycosylase SLT domain-containing protein [Bryobacterales bacterium]